MIKNERNFVLNIQDVPKNDLELKSSHDRLISNQWEPIRIVQFWRFSYFSCTSNAQVTLEVKLQLKTFSE